MNRLKKWRFVLWNLIISLVLVFITLYILDWYNPYMDFMGHATVYKISAVALILINIMIQFRVAYAQSILRKRKKLKSKKSI